MDMITHVIIAIGGVSIWGVACLMIYRYAAGVPWAAASTVASLWWLVGAAGAASTFVPEAAMLMLLWVSLGALGGVHLHAAYRRERKESFDETAPEEDAESAGERKENLFV
jgi:hypothetical protein